MCCPKRRPRRRPKTEPEEEEGLPRSERMLVALETLAPGVAQAVTRDPLREVLDGGGIGGISAGPGSAGKLNTKVLLRGAMKKNPYPIWSGFEERLREELRKG